MSKTVQKLRIFETEESVRDVIIASAISCELGEYCEVLDSADCENNGGGEALYLCEKGQEEALIRDFGLSDYDVFVKPVRLGAVLDRIVAFMCVQEGGKGSECLAIGPYDLDPAHNLLSERDGEQMMRLTEKETDILCLLHRARGEIVSRDDMLDKVWGYARGLETHTLETHIYRLRQKIEKDAGNPALLLTRDSGYSLSD